MVSNDMNNGIALDIAIDKPRYQPLADRVVSVNGSAPPRARSMNVRRRRYSYPQTTTLGPPMPCSLHLPCSLLLYRAAAGSCSHRNSFHFFLPGFLLPLLLGATEQNFAPIGPAAIRRVDCNHSRHVGLHRRSGSPSLVFAGLSIELVCTAPPSAIALDHSVRHSCTAQTCSPPPSYRYPLPRVSSPSSRSSINPAIASLLLAG